MTKLAGVRRKVILASLLTMVLLATGTGRGVAHSPHDVINNVAFSPKFATDHTMFAISDSRPIRSTDGGEHWVEMVWGLTGRPARFATSPADPRVVYMSTRGAGVFRSNDQGLQWKATNTGPSMQNTTELAVSPTSADVVVAANELGPGLFRTDDGGDTWKGSSGVGKVNAVTFVPELTGRVVVGEATGGLSLSDDDGATFKRTAKSGDGADITAVTAAPKGAGSILFAGTNNGEVLRSDNAGASWSKVSSNIPDRQIRSLALSVDYATDHTLWASTWHKGVYRSNDEGKTWTAQSKGLTTDPQADDLEQPQFANLAVAPLSSGKQLVGLSGFDGLFDSSDEGSHWHAIQTLSEYVTGMAVSPDYDHDGTVVVNSYVKGVYVSRDHGRSFVASDNGLGERRLGEGNELLPLRRMHNVVFSPGYAKDHTIFTATWVRFVRSTDGGKTWVSILVAPSPPNTPLREFVIAVSPNYTADHTIFLGTRQGDFYRSTEGGVAGSWSTASKLDGGVRSGVRSIVVSPAFEKDRTLFASTEKGIVTSSDAGSHWTKTGPEGISLLAISSSYASDGTVFAGTESGLYVTRNRGKAWTELTAAPLSRSTKVAAIGVSPDFKNDKTVLLSVAGTGLFRSRDAGRTFSAVGASLLEHSLIIADFENPTSEPIQFSRTFATDHTVYAYAQQSAVRSTDGGDTWEVLDIPTAAQFVGHPNGDGLPVLPIALVGVVVVAVVAFVIYRKRAPARPQAPSSP